MSTAEEIIDGELVPYEPPTPMGVDFVGLPEEMLAKATEEAKALKKYLDRTNSVVKIRGSEHVKVGGWQFLARRAGLTVGSSVGEPFSFEGETGWWGHANVYRDGVKVGEADALCTRSEKNWEHSDTYAICSMAQTRAVSKAIKNILGFVVVMAGYSDTPAEEMPREPRPRQTKDKAKAMRDRIHELAGEADGLRGEQKTLGEIEATSQKTWDKPLADLSESQLSILGTDLKEWLENGAKGPFQIVPF